MANKIHDLVQKLITRTDLAKVSWEITTTEGTYQVSFPNYAVRLFARPSQSNSEAVDYVLTLHDEEGRLVDEITDVALEESGFQMAFMRMARLYSAARRTALGVDKVIDGLLSNLED